MALIVGGGGTTGDMESESGGAPAFTTVLSRPPSGPVAESWTEIGPTKMLGAGNGAGCYMRGLSRRKSPKSLSVRGRD